MSTGARKSTPIDLLHILLGIPFLKDRFSYFKGIQDLRRRYCIKDHPLRILELKHENNIKSMFNHGHFMTSVVSKGTLTLEVFKHLITQTNLRPNPQPFKSLYLYSNNLHTNKILKCNLSSITSDPIKKNNEIFFWSDGSSECNPGRSAFAWHGEGSKGETKYPFINHINNAELDAIQSILNHIINNKNKYNKATVIKIFF